MEATVKHRIVGSLMLLSLAVIILPFWLDGAGLEDYQTTQKPPAMPSSTFELIDATPGTGIDLTINPSDMQVLELSPISLTKDSSTVVETIVQPKAAKAAKAAKPAKPKAPAPSVAKTKPKQDDSLLNAQGLPNGWAVQLGSFGNQSNAIRLKDKVLKAGFSAYIIPNGKLFKVLVGPELNRSKAEALKKQIDTKFKMNSLVILYGVVKP